MGQIYLLVQKANKLRIYVFFITGQLTQGNGNLIIKGKGQILDVIKNSVWSIHQRGRIEAEETFDPWSAFPLKEYGLNSQESNSESRYKLSLLGLKLMKKLKFYNFRRKWSLFD